MFALITMVLTLSIASNQQTRIGGGQIIQNGIVTPPQAIAHHPPQYTIEAHQRRVEGTVTVEAAFDIDGNFTVLRVVKGLGLGLDEKALEALKDWRFSPAYRNGARVSVISQIDIPFKLPENERFIKLLKEIQLKFVQKR